MALIGPPRRCSKATDWGFLCTLAFNAACGDVVDLTGAYEVDSEVAWGGFSYGQCGVDMFVSQGDGYVTFTKGEYDGAPVFRWIKCDQPEGPQRCTADGILLEPDDDGWITRTAVAGWRTRNIPFGCEFSWSETTATRNDGHLVLETRTAISLDRDIAMEQCTTKEAEERGAPTLCISWRLDATLLRDVIAR